MRLSQEKREEIRVGKAMVRRSKAMKPLTINPETREGKVLRVLPSGGKAMESSPNFVLMIYPLLL